MIRLAFYGDDFTGSTDALEVLAFAGLRCALFLAPPTRESLEQIGELDAIGVAGDSRGMSPQEMDDRLTTVFQALAALKLPIVHYKVCSTFDSSPHIGSIGRALEIGKAAFGTVTVPIVAGTPGLGRYCLFGHLFARSGTDGKVYRIDRHPIMSAHPVTPMDESSLVEHLTRQATLGIEVFNYPNLEGDRASIDAHWNDLASRRPDAVLFDTASPRHLTEVGRLIESLARLSGPTFIVGSSGAEYALTQWWKESDEAQESPAAFATVSAADKVLVISGSASRLSSIQIDQAVEAGFVDVAIDSKELLDDTTWEVATDRIVTASTEALQSGRSVILHTARGPEDPRIEQMIESLIAKGQTRGQAKHEGGRVLGVRLGNITRKIVEAAQPKRLLLSGGDTSSQITQVLGPEALVIAARLAPGAPLCRLISKHPSINGLEVALKGGQMGSQDFFVKALKGTV